MSHAAFLKILGIKPVADRSAIRRAYAQRLKEIDPDTDPQAFIALREALERATAWADRKSRPNESGAFVALPFQVDIGPVREAPPACDHVARDGAASSAPAPAVSGPWGNVDGSAPDLAPPDRVDVKAMDVIETLLFDQGDLAPDPDVLLAAVRRLLNDPAMKSVDQADWVEHWLAESLASSIPRSDPVVGLVAGHFGWDRDKGRWDQGHALQYVVARHEGLSLLDRLANPKHDWHEAYLELTSTDLELGRGAFLKKRAVRTLLEFMRANAPEAEGGLNSNRVNLWDEKLYGVAGYRSDFEEAKSQWWWTWPLVLVVMALGRCLPNDSRSTRPPPIEQRTPSYVPEKIEIPLGDNKVQVFTREEIINITEGARERGRADARNMFEPAAPPPTKR